MNRPPLLARLSQSAVRFQARQCTSKASIIPGSEVDLFIRRCMQSVGTRVNHAEVLASLLVTADSRGHYSHGLNRLPMYVDDVITKTTAIDAEPIILRQSAASAYVDGNNILGPPIGKFCMDLAIEKAKAVGVGMVVCKGSNHYGIAGWYTMRAVEQGLLGVCMTNTSPLVVPTRAKKATLGTNPISVAAPGKNGDSFVLDMATSTAALGKVEMCKRKGQPIPPSWGVDSEGQETFKPEDVLSSGALMPLGGKEITGGYKGYGLAVMVEVFCGILGGAAYGPNIRKWMNPDNSKANLGQFFMAADPGFFAPEFVERMSDMMDYLRSMETSDGGTSVLVPGDPERASLDLVAQEGGIRYHPSLVTAMDSLAKVLNVNPMSVTKYVDV